MPVKTRIIQIFATSVLTAAGGARFALAQVTAGRADGGPASTSRAAEDAERRRQAVEFIRQTTERLSRQLSDQPLSQQLRKIMDAAARNDTAGILREYRELDDSDGQSIDIAHTAPRQPYRRSQGTAGDTAARQQADTQRQISEVRRAEAVKLLADAAHLLETSRSEIDGTINPLEPFRPVHDLGIEALFREPTLPESDPTRVVSVENTSESSYGFGGSPSHDDAMGGREPSGGSGGGLLDRLDSLLYSEVTRALGTNRSSALDPAKVAATQMASKSLDRLFGDSLGGLKDFAARFAGGAAVDYLQELAEDSMTDWDAVNSEELGPEMLRLDRAISPINFRRGIAGYPRKMAERLGQLLEANNARDNERDSK